MHAVPQPVDCPAWQDCLAQYGLEHACEAVLVANAEGHLLYANNAACRLLGQTCDELLQLTLLDVFTDLPSGATEESSLETTCRRGDGGQIAVEVALNHPEREGRRFLCAFAREITERKQLEEQLREAHKMEAVGRLVDGVSHDFNNLLTAILIYIGLVLNQLPSDSPLRGHAEQVSSAAERGRSLISQLLGLGRKHSVQPAVLSLNQVVEGVRDMLARLVGEDIVLDVSYEDPLGAVEADRTQLEQMLVNLAVNARDAMPQGGVLRIATANFSATERFARGYPGMTPGAYVTLTVSDTGCGMDAETRSHAFEPFFTTKESGRGTGLGLSTVYSIVRQNGGQISLESAPGQGTTVRAFLPRVAAETKQILAPRRPETSLAASGTVLIVEDEELVRRSLHEILAGKGYRVLQARHAREAMWIGKEYEGRIDLMLTDLVMPGMSGTELAERIRPVRPRMRVLYISGYREDVRIRRLEAAGEAFLPKPFTAAAVAEKVGELLVPAEES